MLQMNLFAGQEERHRQTKDHGHSGEGTGKMKWAIRIDKYTSPYEK